MDCRLLLVLVIVITKTFTQDTIDIDHKSSADEKHAVNSSPSKESPNPVPKRSRFSRSARTSNIDGDLFDAKNTDTFDPTNTDTTDAKNKDSIDAMNTRNSDAKNTDTIDANNTNSIDTKNESEAANETYININPAKTAEPSDVSVIKSSSTDLSQDRTSTSDHTNVLHPSENPGTVPEKDLNEDPFAAIQHFGSVNHRVGPLFLISEEKDSLANSPPTNNKNQVSFQETSIISTTTKSQSNSFLFDQTIDNDEKSAREKSSISFQKGPTLVTTKSPSNTFLFQHTIKIYGSRSTDNPPDKEFSKPSGIKSVTESPLLSTANKIEKEFQKVSQFPLKSNKTKPDNSKGSHLSTESPLKLTETTDKSLEFLKTFTLGSYGIKKNINKQFESVTNTSPQLSNDTKKVSNKHIEMATELPLRSAITKQDNNEDSFTLPDLTSTDNNNGTESKKSSLDSTETMTDDNNNGLDTSGIFFEVNHKVDSLFGNQASEKKTSTTNDLTRYTKPSLSRQMTTKRLNIPTHSPSWDHLSFSRASRSSLKTKPAGTSSQILYENDPLKGTSIQTFSGKSGFERHTAEKNGGSTIRSVEIVMSGAVTDKLKNNITTKTNMVEDSSVYREHSVHGRKLIYSTATRPAGPPGTTRGRSSQSADVSMTSSEYIDMSVMSLSADRSMTSSVSGNRVPRRGLNRQTTSSKYNAKSNNVIDTMTKSTPAASCTMKVIRVQGEAGVVTDLVLQVLCGSVAVILLGIATGMLILKCKRLNTQRRSLMHDPAGYPNNSTDPGSLHRLGRQVAVIQMNTKTHRLEPDFGDTDSWDGRPEMMVSTNAKINKQNRLDFFAQTADERNIATQKESQDSCAAIESLFERRKSRTLDSLLSCDSKTLRSVTSSSKTVECLNGKSSFHVSKTYDVTMAVENKTYIFLGQSTSLRTSPTNSRDDKLRDQCRLFCDKEEKRTDEVKTYTSLDQSHPYSTMSAVSDQTNNKHANPCNSICDKLAKPANGINNYINDSVYLDIEVPTNAHTTKTGHACTKDTSTYYNTEAKDVCEGRKVMEFPQLNEHVICESQLKSLLQNKTLGIDHNKNKERLASEICTIEMPPLEDENTCLQANIRDTDNEDKLKTTKTLDGLPKNDSVMFQTEMMDNILLSSKINNDLTCNQKVFIPDKSSTITEATPVCIRKCFEEITDGQLTDKNGVTQTPDIFQKVDTFRTYIEPYQPEKDHNPGDLLDTMNRPVVSSPGTLQSSDIFQTATLPSRDIPQDLKYKHSVITMFNEFPFNETTLDNVETGQSSCKSSLSTLHDSHTLEKTVLSSLDTSSTRRFEAAPRKATVDDLSSERTIQSEFNTSNNMENTNAEKRTYKTRTSEMILKNENTVDTRRKVQMEGNPVADSKGNTRNKECSFHPLDTVNIEQKESNTKLKKSTFVGKSRYSLKRQTAVGTKLQEPLADVSCKENIPKIASTDTSERKYSNNNGPVNESPKILSADSGQPKTNHSKTGKEFLIMVSNDHSGRTFPNMSKDKIGKKCSDIDLIVNENEEKRSACSNNGSLSKSSIPCKGNQNRKSIKGQNVPSSFRKELSDFTFGGARLQSLHHREARSKTDSELMCKNKTNSKRNKQMNVVFQDIDTFIKDSACLNAYTNIAQRSHEYKSKTSLSRETSLCPRYNVIHSEEVYSPFERANRDRKEMTDKKSFDSPKSLLTSGTFIVSKSRNSASCCRPKSSQMKTKGVTVYPSQVRTRYGTSYSQPQTRKSSEMRVSMKTMHRNVETQKSKYRSAPSSVTADTGTKQKASLQTRGRGTATKTSMKMSIPGWNQSTNIQRSPGSLKINELHLHHQKGYNNPSPPSQVPTVTFTNLLREKTYDIKHDFKEVGEKENLVEMPTSNDTNTLQLPVLSREITFDIKDPSIESSVAWQDAPATLPKLEKGQTYVMPQTDIHKDASSVV